DSAGAPAAGQRYRTAIWQRAVATARDQPTGSIDQAGGRRDRRPLIADLGHTRIDLDRIRRTGMPEAVYARDKEPHQVVEIVGKMLSNPDIPVLVTRTSQAHRDALSAALLVPDAIWSETLTWNHAERLDVAPVAVVSGGTSDQSVVDECVGTLTALGVPARAVRDVGVAGLHRLLDSIDGFAESSVIVAVAGMEASLATVLAGLVPNPIVAVPTSVGYGATFDGLTALLSVMSSCAPGISVVGIDNGFGAACAALRIVRTLN
ncbi:MAG: nickel pincer cofactor biosynthesis protein LarB, partial [Acidimicrobiales bacterium]